ncbi:MAG: hypothetical protein IT579_17960, partial [Verrucomicrobia subdivision 3 bacterium]|nr:hypothetical protein [Limisphaerales bacterium]
LGLQAKYKRHGNDAGEPDVLYEWKQKILGIEVATAYRDDLQAKYEWDIARGVIKPTKDLETLLSYDDFDERVCRRIQQEINGKCVRPYTGAQTTWLCIERRALISDHDAAVACARRLKVPTKPPFAGIFIYYAVPLHEGGDYRVINLLGVEV